MPIWHYYFRVPESMLRREAWKLASYHLHSESDHFARSHPLHLTLFRIYLNVLASTYGDFTDSVRCHREGNINVESLYCAQKRGMHRS